MKIVAVILLIAYGGAMAAAIGSQLWPLIRLQPIEILIAVYLLLSAVELARASAHTYVLWSEATSRLSGGFFRKIGLNLALAAKGRFGPILFYISIVSEALAHSLAWPLPFLIRKLSSKVAKNSNEVPLLNFAAIFDVWGTVAKAAMVLLVCVCSYIFCALITTKSAAAVSSLFSIFAIFCNLTLISIATHPKDIAARLRQQPGKPLFVILALLVTLATIQTLSFYAMSVPRGLTNIKGLINSGKSLTNVPDLSALSQVLSWKLLDIWKLLSGVLLSTVIIQAATRLKELRRVDLDYLSMAQKYLSVRNLTAAKRNLKMVSALTPAHQEITAVLEYSEGNEVKARLAVLQAVNLTTHDVPKALSDDELGYLSVVAHVKQLEISVPIVIKEVVGFLVKCPRPLFCIAVCDIVYLSGRMSTQDIRKLLVDLPDNVCSVCNVALAVLDSQPRRALRSLDCINPELIGTWLGADRVAIKCLGLVLQLAVHPSTDLKVTFAHRWCLTNVSDVKNGTAESIASGETVPTGIILNYLEVASEQLKLIAPIDAETLKLLSEQCAAHLQMSGFGRSLYKGSRAARAQLQSGLHDHGVS